MNSEGWSEPSPFSEPGFFGALKPREKPPRPTTPTLTALGKGKLRVSWAIPTSCPPVEATQVQLTDVGTGNKWLVDESGALVTSGRTTFAATRTEGFGEYSMASDGVANIDAKDMPLPATEY
ncbi:TTN [Symbiodinium natans]|uniref:TTN protein n=1 Tax=Symbiodinium natans TaxID=878477 RepID=A0A812QNY6_9DINO|nr:TTN [Symbiodinium natans]